MWARVVELMLGLWLLASPFIFRHRAGELGLWLNDLACGSIVITVALVSFWRPARHTHLLLIPAGLWLIGNGYLAPRPPPAALQNNVLVGWLLLVFSIVPSDINRPPEAWRRFNAAKTDAPNWSSGPEKKQEH
jgi:hypothetical protein